MNDPVHAAVLRPDDAGTHYARNGAQEENCFPMFAAGAGHHEVMLADGRMYQPRA